MVLGGARFFAIGNEGTNRNSGVHPREGSAASIEESEDGCQRCGRCANRGLWRGRSGLQGASTGWVRGVTSRRAVVGAVLAGACWMVVGGWQRG